MKEKAAIPVWLLLAILVLHVGGVTLVTWSSGDKITATKLNAINGLIWKDTPATALTKTNQAADIAWTDLDLSSYTSADAVAAYIQLRISIDTQNKYYVLEARKNGCTPVAGYPSLYIWNAEASETRTETAIIGLDSNQLMEYQLVVEAGGQCDAYIYVLGYWE